MNNLKVIRKHNNLTQADIAKILDCSTQAYQRYEKEEREADYTTLCKLADYFDTSIDYLLNRTDNPLWTKEELALGVGEHNPKISDEEWEIIELFSELKRLKGEGAAHAVKTMIKAFLDGK